MRRSRAFFSIILAITILLGMQFMAADDVRAASSEFSNVKISDGVLSWDPVPDVKGEYHLSVKSVVKDNGDEYQTSETKYKLDLAVLLYSNGEDLALELTCSDANGNDYRWTGTYDVIQLHDPEYIYWNMDDGYVECTFEKSSDIDIYYTVFIDVDGWERIIYRHVGDRLPQEYFVRRGTHSYKITYCADADPIGEVAYRFSYKELTSELKWDKGPMITGLELKDNILSWDEVPGADHYSIYTKAKDRDGKTQELKFNTDRPFYSLFSEFYQLADSQDIEYVVAAMSSDNKRIAYADSYILHYEEKETDVYPLGICGAGITSDADLARLSDMFFDVGSGYMIYYPSEKKIIMKDFKGTAEPLNPDAHIIDSYDDLTIEGTGCIESKTIPIRCTGNLTIAEGSDIRLISEDSRGIEAENVYINGKLTIESGKEAICARNEIKIGDSCPSVEAVTHSSDGKTGAIKSENGKIDLGRTGIKVPANGTLSADSKTILQSDGSVAKKVTLKPGTSKPAPTVPAVKPTGAAVPSVPASSTGVPASPAVSSSPDVTSHPTAAPGRPVAVTTIAPIADPKAEIMDFVARIYTFVLDREPEEEGAKFWTEELYSFRRTGSEVGLQFIFSDEFVNRDTTDDEFVTILYKTFFGREPEEEGFKFWTDALREETMSREQVAGGFVYSQEWADTCARYGIRSGGIEPSVELVPGEACVAFVKRMYTTAMSREADKSGLDFWSRELANFRYTGEQVGVMFFLSDEMNGFGLSNEEFVTRLYKTFMDREPEEGGFDFWVGYLADGGSRSDVVYGFTRSEEFVNKCVEARILPY